MKYARLPVISRLIQELIQSEDCRGSQQVLGFLPELASRRFLCERFRSRRPRVKVQPLANDLERRFENSRARRGGVSDGNAGIHKRSGQIVVIGCFEKPVHLRRIGVRFHRGRAGEHPTTDVQYCAFHATKMLGGEGGNGEPEGWIIDRTNRYQGTEEFVGVREIQPASSKQVLIRNQMADIPRS